MRENVPVEQIFVTGNTGIDALQWAATLDVPFANPAVRQLCDERPAHRRRDRTSPRELGRRPRGIAEGVARSPSAQPGRRFVLPLHPNPRVREQLSGPLAGLENVLLTEPLGYATFAKLLARCDLVITDSGGIQEEAPSLDKPVLVARETTERTEGIEAGTLRLVGTDPERIFARGRRACSTTRRPTRRWPSAEPLRRRPRGRADHRRARALLLGSEPPAPFGPGYSRARGDRAQAGSTPGCGAADDERGRRPTTATDAE